MGKRELLIALAFAVAGIVTYWLTGPPRSGPPRTQSLPALVDQWRDAGARTAARATIQSIGSVALPPHVSELRLSGFAQLHVTGGAGADVSWTLDVDAAGRSPEAAREVASAVTLGHDDLGSAIALEPRSPHGTTVTTTLTILVPAGIAVHVGDAQVTDVRGVARLRLDGVVGDVRVVGTTTITGAHRNGTLDIQDAQDVDLGMVGSRATLTGIRGEVRLTARNGECRLTAPRGPVSVDGTNALIAVTDAEQTVRLNASGGSVLLDRPRADVHVDGRRTSMVVDLATAVGVTLVGTDTAIEVRVDDATPVTIDASVDDGLITTPGRTLAVEDTGTTARLRHTFGTRARVSIRNHHGPIVIAQRK